MLRVCLRLLFIKVFTRTMCYKHNIIIWMLLKKQQQKQQHTKKITTKLDGPLWMTNFMVVHFFSLFLLPFFHRFIFCTFDFIVGFCSPAVINSHLYAYKKHLYSIFKQAKTENINFESDWWWVILFFTPRNGHHNNTIIRKICSKPY